MSKNYKKLFFSFLIIFNFAISQDKQQQTMAILNFENNCLLDREKMQPLSKGLADMMSSEMSKIKGLKLVERNRIKSIIDEMNLQETGILDESSTQKIGKLLGAKNMMFGSFTKSDEDEIRIDVRIVRTETGETINAEEETGDVRQFVTLLRSIAKSVAKDLNVKLTSEEEDYLDAELEGNFEAYVSFSEAIALEDEARYKEKSGDLVKAKAGYQKALKLYQDASSKSPNYLPAKEKVQQVKTILSKIK
ncbi:MAG: hypothetical protein O3A55_03495 [Bacteroidetes bacterium]|nr:hypothetical protein [Bacteroidota bacterium]